MWRLYFFAGGHGLDRRAYDAVLLDRPADHGLEQHVAFDVAEYRLHVFVHGGIDDQGAERAAAALDIGRHAVQACPELAQVGQQLSSGFVVQQRLREPVAVVERRGQLGDAVAGALPLEQRVLAFLPVDERVERARAALDLRQNLVDPRGRRAGLDAGTGEVHEQALRARRIRRVVHQGVRQAVAMLDGCQDGCERGAGATQVVGDLRTREIADGDAGGARGIADLGGRILDLLGQRFERQPRSRPNVGVLLQARLTGRAHAEVDDLVAE